MSSPQPPNLTIAVLGATGGCALHFLVHALNSGYTCTALVRTPSKLLGLLAQHNVPERTISTHLTIRGGNVKDGAAVSGALAPAGRIVDLIVSGVGGKPSFSPNPLRPTLDDPTICADATAAVLASLRTLQAQARAAGQDARKPLFVVVSSTGISDFGRDIPFAMFPLYHWLLPVPHADKKAMERLLVAESAKPAAGEDGKAIEGFVGVRPSLLTDGPATEGRLKVGVEDGKVDKGGIGYTISRADVGKWIFENVLKEWEGRGRWVDKFVGLSS